MLEFVSSAPVSAAALADLLELVARKIHSMGYAEDLFPARWVALRYFARAQKNLRAASELARFQGMAVGPVSRAVRKLVEKGLLQKAVEQPRGRAEWLERTERGEKSIEGDLIQPLASILAALPVSDKLSLAIALEAVARGLEPDAAET